MKKIENLAVRYRREDLQERAEEQRGLEILRAGLLLASGLSALVFPDLAGDIAIRFLAALSAFLAAYLAIRAVQLRRFGIRRLLRVAAFGIMAYVFVAAPVETVFILAGLIIVVFLVDGGMKLYSALTIKRHPRRREFLVSGAIMLVVGLILWLTLGSSARPLIGAVAGFALVAEGWGVSRALWETRAKAFDL